MRRLAPLAVLALACAAAEAAVTVERDIAYDQQPGVRAALLSLDVHAPEGAVAAPVAVLVHDGAWTGGDKGDWSRFVPRLTGAGYVVVALNHRLAPSATPREMARDVAAALAWTADHIHDHGGDALSIDVIGHGSGAHLAALATSDPAFLEDLGHDLNLVRALALVDGVAYDVPHLLSISSGSTRGALERAFGTGASIQAEASPATHLQAGRRIPPTLLMAAERPAELRELADRHAEAIRAAGGVAQVTTIAGTDDRALARALATAGSDALEQLLAFLADPAGWTPPGGDPLAGEPDLALDGAATMISLIDQDGDGRLSRREAPGHLRRRFDDLDADADGNLTAQELAEVARQWGQGGLGGGGRGR